MLKDLREKHAKLASDYKSLMAGIHAEKRERLTDDERIKINTMNDDLNSLEELITAAQRSENLDADLSESAGRKSAGPLAASSLSMGTAQREQDASLALRGWLRDNVAVDGRPLGATDEQRESMTRVGFTPGQEAYSIDMRAALSDAYVRGGSELPVGIAGSVASALKQFGPIREHVTQFTTDTGNVFHVITNDDTAGSIIAVNEVTDPAIVKPTFNKVSFGAFKYSTGLFQLSSEALQDSAFDVESFIGQIIGTRFGRGLSNLYTNGAGTTEPVGITTCDAGATGATGSIASQVIYSKLIDLYHSIDPAYRDNAKWMFNDAFLKIVRTLEDEEGNLIWQPDASTSAPATILGKPYVINQSMPAHAPTKALALFGELRNYWIRNVRNITLMRSTERFLEHDATAFVAFMRTDGKPVDPGKGIKAFVAGSLS